MANTISTLPFAGTAEQEARLDEVISAYKGQSGALIPVLQKTQEIYGYLPIEVEEKIATGLGISLEKVYEVVTFYAQFALNPKTSEYFLIEINPRVSRSSALASKASGYPIARVTAKVAVGMNLDEIAVANTTAAFEPSLDYVVAKLPRFPFDKFSTAANTLGTQMKATGEVMGIGSTLEECLLKSVRSLEIGAQHLWLPKFQNMTKAELTEYLHQFRDDGLFAVAQLLRLGASVDEVAALTMITPYFLETIRGIVDMEQTLCAHKGDGETLKQAKQMGFCDPYIARLWGVREEDVYAQRVQLGLYPAYKMVDTSHTGAYIPYFYSTYAPGAKSEARRSDKKKVVVLGAGPIRIGQGVEFDYSTVHAVQTIRRAGYEAIIINNNPETVSTDYTTADKLYFEPLTPEDVKPYLAPDQYQVYRLIWARFVASQMAAARFHDTTVTIDNGPAQWRSKGERMLFPGFLAVMPRGKDEEGVELPALTKGETLKLNSLTKEQKFTQPSPRFTEASLVRELEELGIGRPSTYASIISTLQDRDYVTLEEKHFAPTDLGRVVCDRLREHFKTLMDVGFTAHMEELLDKVAEGQQDWVALLRNFNNDFDPTLLEAAKSMGKAKTDTVTDIPCPECGKPLAVKFGKTGQFLACTGYPACRYTSNYTRDEQGQIHLQEKVKPEFEKVGTCPECGKDLVLKRSRTGSRFIACSGYPDCKHAEPYSTGVPCPREGCNGVLVEKSSKRGKIFYSCSNYPQCDYALWDWPIAEPCPECGSPLLVLKNTKAKGKFIACPEKTCKYTRPLEGGSEDDAE